MKITFAGDTDVGRVREHNEDAFAIVPDENLVVVCDGMGGHAAGEVASGIAIETITTIVKQVPAEQFSSSDFKWPGAITDDGKILVGAIAAANHRVIDHGRHNPTRGGLGTTVVSCKFNEGIVSVCHVGDSRVYLVRDGAIKRLTVDHSWVSEVMEKHNISEAEAEAQVNKNVITRALGTKPAIRTDISQLRLLKNDLYLLCSDGLCGMITDSDILHAALESGEDLNSLVSNLIAQANEAGGADNITVCVARVDDDVDTENFNELRGLTVDWDADPELGAIESLANEHFPKEAYGEDPEAAEETQKLTVEEPKKKRP